LICRPDKPSAAIDGGTESCYSSITSLFLASLSWAAMMSKQKNSTKIRVHRNTNDGSHASSDSVTMIDPVLLDQVSAFVDDPEAWFETPNEYFEGRKPRELLGTDDETRLRNRIQGALLGFFS
jgi:hypothetical protein